MVVMASDVVVVKGKHRGQHHNGNNEHCCHGERGHHQERHGECCQQGEQKVMSIMVMPIMAAVTVKTARTW